MNRTYLLGLLLIACGLPADANPALRCEDGVCPTGMACHAGFCLSADALTGDEDASALPEPEVDAGMAVTPPPEPAPMPTPDAGMPGGEDDDESDGDEQTTCECKLTEVCVDGMCCSLGDIVCDDECVDPKKDKHHCGGCGNECDKGSCKLGICVRSR